MSNQKNTSQDTPRVGGRGGNVPAMPVKKAKDTKGTFKRLVEFLKPYHLGIVLVFVFAIVSTSLAALGPRILSFATNEILVGSVGKEIGIRPNIDFSAVMKFIMITAGIYITSGIIAILERHIMSGITQKAMFELRGSIDRKLGKLPLRYYDTHAFGDILSRVTNDVDTVSSALQQNFVQMMSSVISLAAILVMMLSISPILTLLVLITVPPVALISQKIIKSSQKNFVGQQRTLGELNGYVEEIFSGHTIVKAFGTEVKVSEEFEKLNETLYDYGRKAQFTSSIMMPMSNFMSNLGYIAVVVVWSMLAIAGKLLVSDIQAFVSYLRQFSQPINQAANIANVFQSTIAAAERIFELLDEPEESPAPEFSPAFENCSGHVTFEHVKFGYTPDRTIIRDFSLEVPSGSRVALVGPTGAGKTTIVNLIMRFYDVDSGVIKLDGQDIYGTSRAMLRDNLGMVLQDTWLFKGTVKENIRYGKPDATDEEVIAAAKAARAHTFIKQLPDRYDFKLSEDAANISQGQRQLVTIARAILSNPKILILDEATSSVDTRTEAAIQQGMDNLMQSRTSFVIAHRLSTIRDADTILFINNGDIAEAGSHDELIAKGGLYANLYNSQFRGESEEEEPEPEVYS